MGRWGSLLAVMRVKDFDQALEWANDPRFALTGSVFSRSPAHLDRARREFRVGAKAGGPDYLLQFMDARVVTENNLRRGFAADANP